MLHDTIFLLIDCLVLAFFIRSLFRKKGICRLAGFTIVSFGLSYYKLNMDMNLPFYMGEILMIFIPVAVIIILTYCLYQRNLVVSITTGILITVVIVFLQILALLITNFSLYLLSITLSIEIHRDICQILYMLGMLITAYYMWINQDNIYEKVIRYCETKSERTQRYVKYIKFGITLFLMLTFTVLGEGIYDKLGISNESFMLICFTILLAATIFLLTYYESIITSYRNRQIEERNKLNEIHQDFVDNINYFGHSYNNMMQAVNFFVNCEELKIEDVRTVLKDLLEWDEKNKINYKLKYINIPNTVVASILSMKQDYARELGVNLKVIYDGSSNVKINSKIFVDLINIIVDNAIEVAHFTEDKTVYINLIFDDNRFEFTTKNFKNYDKNGKLLKYGTSKHIGLRNIEEMVRKNISINYDIIDGEGEFEIRLIINN
ncbi:ATP-binding protein [Lachnoclostridium phytofermentans]|uniref:Signal transduction histidine kinase regulating citrate/malate metabolism n=1 Tax=Lachnoclostridium phytofermentans (strain ATCC 700394 / DSM 18823 / ISDg) TaxID=357809 RepID=A9KPE8_LACP7|nr:signal transduction histidine kinase [Lachnoclostridium phytofermentans]ABX43222.1 signal transduction histidine kinase regulating citrate/malate metabolism [Lachnoclostridium phytofermentans ISDg]